MKILAAFSIALCSAVVPLCAQNTPQTVYLLDGAGTSLFTVQARDGATPGPTVAISGINAGDELMAIDMRPQNQRLYALGVNATADTVQLYHLQPETGIVTPIGVPAQFTTDGATVVDLPATVWDIDFNPGVDRLRVVSQSGLNFRMNPNTGAGVDGDGGVAGVNMDGSINGGTTALRGAAYTNNQPQNGFDASTTTSLYTFDGQGVYLQNPPNSGTQVLLINPRFAIQNVRGFDLPPGADAAFPNGRLSIGRGFFASDSGSGTTIVWDIELNDGVFQPDPRFLVEVPGSVRSLCVRTTLDAFVALEAAGTTLHRFRPLTAGTSVTATISGVTAGETLVSIAGRPQTGQLYGFGVNATADTGTLYLLDPQTGAATVVGVAGAIAFVDASGSPVDLPDSGTGYGMDFNPTVDRVRIVTGSGLNFRLNPITGGAVDGNLGSAAIVAGTNPDGALNGGSTVATATAYTNSFAQSLTGGVTTQYAYNSRTGSVFIQNPPNAGTLGFAFSISFFDFFAPAAMDIPAMCRCLPPAAPRQAMHG